MDFYFWLAAGSVAGGFVNGMAGFGTALFALGFWLQILPPSEAVPLVVVMSVVSGLQGVALVRQSVRENLGCLSRFIVPGIVGIPFGVKFLSIASPFALKLTIATFLIGYSGFVLIRRNLPRLSQPKPAVDYLIGFAGGFLGGAASLSGVLPTIWCTLQPWTKSEQRAVMQVFNISILSIAGATYAMSGYYSVHSASLILIALPMTLISAQAGIWAFKQLSDNQFRRLLVSLMFVSGLILVVNELLPG